MARMISEQLMKEQAYVKFGYDEFMYMQITDFIMNLPKSDAIPVNFILDFMKDRDPVYKSNLISMLNTYNQEVEERDRIPIHEIQKRPF